MTSDNRSLYILGVVSMKTVRATRAYPTLAAWREAKRLTQREAAAHVGITQAYWSMLENGHAAPRPELAKKLADETGVALETLLGIAS